MSILYEKFPLNARSEIRLLRLHSRSSSPETSQPPLETDLPINCDLYAVSIRDARTQGYEALSYSWGSTNELLAIRVNGENVLATRNLYDALQHLREESEEVILWVDAICINQKDVAEKTEQVNMMREIYAFAKNTKVWLGPADEGSGETMLQISEIGKMVIDRKASEHFITMTNLAIEDPSAAAYAEEQARRLIQDMLDKSLVHLTESCGLLVAFKKLLSRTYWKRVWILQEIVVSRKVEVHCGKEKLGFEVLHAALLYIIYMRHYLCTQTVTSLTALLDSSVDGALPPQYGLEEQRFHTINSAEIPPSASLVSGMRLRYHDPVAENGETNLSLIHLLARVRVGREATDPRDRIWALLGMAADTGILRIIPDYAETNSCAAVYCNATRAMITSGHVDILAFSQWTKEDPEMPSWAPDWREEVKQPCGQLPWETPYSASGSSKFVKTLEQVVSISHLKLNGFLVDTIESLKPQCNNGEWLSMEHRHQACTYINDIMKLCQISNKKFEDTGVEIYADPTVRQRAYQRVPVADLYSTGLVRRATVDECHLGHAEVITDYRQRQNHGPNAGSPMTNTFRSYYIMMGQQVDRRPFVTVEGFVGLAPKYARDGDTVVVFPGGKFPYVMRRCDDGMYVLVGEAFVHGIMDGEFVNDDREMQEFVLR